MTDKIQEEIDVYDNLVAESYKRAFKPKVLLEKELAKVKKQLEIAKKYLSLIKRNVSVGSLVYTYVANAQTEIRELDK